MANQQLDPQIVATLNDATRALVGGLWSNAVSEGNQGLGSVVRYTDDLNVVKAGIQAFQHQDASPQVAAILNDINTSLAAATATVNGGQGFGSVAAAEAALRTSHLDILSQTTHDPALAASGVFAVPATLADPNHAPHATFAEIGSIFNDLYSRSLGGLTPTTAPAFTKEVATIQSDLKTFIADHGDQFQGLTGIHAQTIVNQLALQKGFDAQYGTNPDAARATNDNLLDIIDIVQGDTNLANMASTNGVHGWSAAPDALKPTTKYQDNADQTHFWADFIAQSNSIGQAAERLVGSHDTAAIKALIGEAHAFEQNTKNFDQAQGGIFEARFDNELLGNKSTTGAEVSALVKGLTSHNGALVTAAAEEMHANAADVSGNNVPVNGGTYNGDGLTVATALSTTVGGDPAPNTPPLVPAATATATAAGGASSSSPSTAQTSTAQTSAPQQVSAAEVHHPVVHEIVHAVEAHVHHLWG